MPEWRPPPSPMSVTWRRGAAYATAPSAHIVDKTGVGCLIDPAVYGGHREIDLAMMRLFGGFGHHVFAAYEEAWPLSPGSAERVPLYQLYFLMVHVNLFGGPYVAQAERALLAIA